MKNILLSLLTATAQYAKEDFIRKTRHTPLVQEQFLTRLLQVQQQTVFGQNYQLGEIRTIAQFQDRIPILPYSSYEPYTERIASGEPNVLTADPVVYLNLTSGSTGAKKLIPVTRRFQNSLQWANLTSIGFLNDALKQQGRSFGKLLVTNSANSLGVTAGGIEYGQASAGVLRMGRWVWNRMFVQSFDAIQISDSLARHYVCLLFALRDASLRGLAANFPMLVLRLCQYLEQYGEDLIRDLQTGTIASWLTLTPNLRDKLEAQLWPDPQRAAQLRQILKSERRLLPHQVWPNLAFVATARGGTSDFYFEHFPNYLGETPTFGSVYASAEGTFSIYPELNQDGSVLAIETGFFEFVPVDQWEVEHPKTLLASEVKPGEYYRILVTNYSGFYRYDIGDVVEVLGFYQQAPLLVFRYRRGGILSATTEKTTEFHATQAMQAMQQTFNVLLEDFCIVLSAGEIPARYLINIELVDDQHLDAPQVFLYKLDRKLQELNAHYAINRLSDRLPPPRLRILAPGSFAQLRQRQVQKGIPDSQLKFPHISEDRTFLAGLTVLQEVKLPEEQKHPEIQEVFH